MGFDYQPIERNKYFYGKLLTVRDFEVEQDYNSVKRRLINRLCNGAGIICGLGVTANDDVITIESGAALDYNGREIVVSEPFTRKIEMIEGSDLLKNKTTAYLCLKYNEENVEPVNMPSREAGEKSYNKTRENYSLYLSPEVPKYQDLLKAEGNDNVNIIYSSDELTIVLSSPSIVCSGKNFAVSTMLVKNDSTLPVKFSLIWENGFIESNGEPLTINFSERTSNKNNVVEDQHYLTISNVSNSLTSLFPSGAEIVVEVGSRKYTNFIHIDNEIFVCENEDKYKEQQIIDDRLQTHLQGETLPLYLAKFELTTIADKVFLNGVTNVPFKQTLKGKVLQESGSLNKMSVKTTVKVLDYWQKPDVQAALDSSGELRFDFSLPKPESYDYKSNHGYVDMTFTGGMKVNGKYTSDEFAHGLGIGNVSVKLSIEYIDGNGLSHLFGNSEIFRGKNTGFKVPWVEVAAVVFPERGTMRIGVWTHDVVEGNAIRVHYYAEKPERDTLSLLDNPQASIMITPEVARIGKRERIRFKGTVSGIENKNVIWKIDESNGSTIDKNGTYQAPNERGTYEITAISADDENIAASAFVIVD